MFSLQTFFSRDEQFFELLEAGTIAYLLVHLLGALGMH